MTETSIHTNHVEHRTMIVIDRNEEAMITITPLPECVTEKANTIIKTSSMCQLANLRKQIMFNHGCSGHKRIAPARQNRFRETNHERFRRECTWSNRLVKRKREHDQSRPSQHAQGRPIAQLLFDLKRGLDTKQGMTNTTTSLK